MIRHSTTIEIGRPPEDVFAALLDLSSYVRWTDMVDPHWLTPGEPRVGTKGEFRMPHGPIKGPIQSEIVELVPNRRIVFENTHPALHWRAMAALEPTATGTKLDYSGELRLRGWRRLLEPLMRGEVEAEERREVERLKALLEGVAAPETGTVGAATG